MPSLVPWTQEKEKEAMLWADDDESVSSPSRCRRCPSLNSSAQYLKLAVLLLVAAVHVGYMNDFLVKFRSFEQLASEIDMSIVMTSNNRKDLEAVAFVMHALVDYKKNLWMTVGAMCASLASTAFFVLLAEQNLNYGRPALVLMRVFDVLAFVSLPLLFAARAYIARSLVAVVPVALRSAEALVHPNEFINQLSCSIEPREQLPLCSAAMLDSIFPVKLIEYLVILCILTGAYIALAYLIQWCIRHFFPPTSPATSTWSLWKSSASHDDLVKQQKVLAVSRDIAPAYKEPLYLTIPSSILVKH